MRGLLHCVACCTVWPATLRGLCSKAEKKKTFTKWPSLDLILGKWPSLDLILWNPINKLTLGLELLHAAGVHATVLLHRPSRVREAVQARRCKRKKNGRF